MSEPQLHVGILTVWSPASIQSGQHVTIYQRRGRFADITATCVVGRSPSTARDVLDRRREG